MHGQKPHMAVFMNYVPMCVQFLGVLTTRALLFGVCIRPLICKNFHVGLLEKLPHCYQGHMETLVMALQQPQARVRASQPAAWLAAASARCGRSCIV